MIRRFFYRRQLPLVLLLCVFAVEHYWIKQSWGLKENFNLAGHSTHLPQAMEETKASGSDIISITFSSDQLGSCPKSPGSLKQMKSRSIADQQGPWN
jgi:hypothetical protein